MTFRKTIVWLIAAISVAVAFMLCLSVLGPSSLPVNIAEPVLADAAPDVWARDMQLQARFTVHNATAEDLGRLGQAVMAFNKAHLELPTVEISFHTDQKPCDDHHGVFRATSESWQIRICSSDIEFVYEHELAHAWVTANITNAQRSAFMNLRGLEHWADRDVPWNQRGTEWAAVVIQQGLSGLPLPPALSKEARSRLQSYELLTGRVAPVLVDWMSGRSVPCSDRPTGLSRPIADSTGRACPSASASVAGQVSPNSARP